MLNQALARAGYAPRATGNAATLWRWVSQGEGDVVITDVVMPDENAFDLIPRIKKLRPDLPIIVMSAQNTLMTALTAAEKGAFEYLPKPFDLTEIVAVVGRALAEPRPAQAQRPAAEAEAEELPLIGRSPAMQEIYRVLARLTQTDLTVMITGETGTGKELVARALHDYGKRRNGPFVAINMAAIPRELIESELFGHEKGAFTGAQTRTAGPLRAGRGRHAVPRRDRRHAAGSADAAAARAAGGRVHHGRRPHADQDRRAHHRRHPPRSASTQIQQGLFREDLFYRLNVVPLRLPPLRERLEDIRDLVRHFLGIAAKEGLPPKTFEPAAIERLKRYHWPGNVRELENLVRRLSALYPQDTSPSRSSRTSWRARPDAVPRCGRAVGRSVRDGRALPVRLFPGFGHDLPPPGLYNRILRRSSGRCSRRRWRRPAATRSAPPRCSGSTATRCARRSATSASRSSGRPEPDVEVLVRLHNHSDFLFLSLDRRGFVTIALTQRLSPKRHIVILLHQLEADAPCRRTA